MPTIKAVMVATIGDMTVKVAVALGGNALLRAGRAADSDIQETHVVSAVNALAPLAGSTTGDHPRQRPAGRHAGTGESQ